MPLFPLTTSPGIDEERRTLQKLLGLRMTSLITAPGVILPEDLSPFLSVVPVLSVVLPESHPRIRGVSYDEEGSGTLIADAVLERGHRDVAVLAPFPAVSVPENTRVPERFAQPKPPYQPSSSRWLRPSSSRVMRPLAMSRAPASGWCAWIASSTDMS